MRKAVEEKRLFHVADSLMIEAAKDKKGFLLEDKTKFESFDPSFSDSFLEEYGNAISLAEAAPDDEEVMGMSVSYTTAVEEKMKLCRDKFQATKYFIDKAFPGDSGKQIEFGYRDYDKARNVQDKMVLFMKGLNKACLKYKAKLNEVHFADEKIAEIELLAVELDEANQAQNQFNNNRPTFTQDHVKKLNAVWAGMGKICEAGKIIFASDYAKLQRYNLPEVASAPKTDVPPPPQS
ncbi:MAG: hypothetical protein Q8N83_06620 [Ignavibacteria bacterium]|nr:hypothetical protein [Ignavibacteria bacterium]